MHKVTLRMGTFADGIMMFCRIDKFYVRQALWLVEKLQNLITKPEIRASVKTKEILVVKEFRPVGFGNSIINFCGYVVLAVGNLLGTVDQ